MCYVISFMEGFNQHILWFYQFSQRTSCSYMALFCSNRSPSLLKMLFSLDTLGVSRSGYILKMRS